MSDPGSTEPPQRGDAFGVPSPAADETASFPPSADLPPTPASPFGDAPKGRGGIVIPRWVALVAALVLLFGAGIAVGRWAIGSRASRAANGSSTPPTSAAPVSPDASALSRVIVQQSDVPSTLNVLLLPNGDQVSQPTLDLCNGSFPTESQRRTRLQDVVADASGNTILSTEAVLYGSAADSARAFSELQSVAAKCPHSPVVSPVGEPTVTTHFDAAPDTHWPALPAGVNRIAFSFTTTDAQGRSTPSIATYLRRGKALVGIYVSNPQTTQPTIGGQTSIPGIVNVFASRLAQLPSSTVTG